MPRRRKKIRRMSERMILKLLKEGIYKVDKNTGEVTGQRGKLITPFRQKRYDTAYEYQFVRLYYKNTVRSIAHGKLVWMSVTLELVPDGFQIHHDDEMPNNNTWSNLICLHRLDHLKQHHSPNGISNETPF